MKLFEDSLVQTTHDLAHVNLTCRGLEVSQVSPDFTASKLIMSVRYDGARSGIIYLFIDEASAIELAFRMLEHASGGYFDRKVIDADLARNTVGEILNISAGDFIRNTGSAGDVRLYSPEQHHSADFKLKGETLLGFQCIFDSSQFDVMFAVA